MQVGVVGDRVLVLRAQTAGPQPLFGDRLGDRRLHERGPDQGLHVVGGDPVGLELRRQRVVADALLEPAVTLLTSASDTVIPWSVAYASARWNRISALERVPVAGGLRRVASRRRSARTAAAATPATAWKTPAVAARPGRCRSSRSPTVAAASGRPTARPHADEREGARTERRGRARTDGEEGCMASSLRGRALEDGRLEPGLGRLARRLAHPGLDPPHEIRTEHPLRHEVQCARRLRVRRAGDQGGQPDLARRRTARAA